MTVMTAVCEDFRGNLVPVQVREQMTIQMTKDRIREDHPDLIFIDWVYEMDSESLKLYFLSPSIPWVKKYVFTENGIEKKKIYRKDIV